MNIRICQRCDANFAVMSVLSDEEKVKMEGHNPKAALATEYHGQELARVDDPWEEIARIDAIPEDAAYAFIRFGQYVVDYDLKLRACRAKNDMHRHNRVLYLDA